MKQLLIIAALVSTATWGQVPVQVLTHHTARTHGPRVPKVKLLRSNPHRFTAIRFQGTDPYDAPDDDYICSSVARRPKVVQPQADEPDELSDYVSVRLAVARARALQKYRELQV